MRVAVVCAVAVLVWGEWLHWRWSRMLTAAPGMSGGSEAILVPGYRNPQPEVNFVNKLRVRAALRSVDPSTDTAIVFSGGDPAGTGQPEARLMARYAQRRLAFTGTVIIEDQSRTTWQNITNAIPLLDGFDRIKIASQPAHALKARAYLRRQRPDLASKLVRANDYRPGELILAKPLLALYGLWTLRELREDERTINNPPDTNTPRTTNPA